MAKPIPKKPVAKAKKKVKRSAEIAEVMSPKAQRKLERKVKDRLDEISENTSSRYKWAKALYDQQPEDVQNVVDQMVKKMGAIAGIPKFTMDGVTYNVDQKLLDSIQHQSHLWIAMRMLISCAEWGIRIGNFKAPKEKCLRCGVKVTPKTKKSVKKKGK